ncbi:hypothetical protein OUZ56_014916 [Daphnia magna]|nr:hypothetical protein OUZ56_014916 [Daphnia magna]
MVCDNYGRDLRRDGLRKQQKSPLHFVMANTCSVFDSSVITRLSKYQRRLDASSFSLSEDIAIIL